MAEAKKYRFKGHESFILREGWLNKGLFALKENPYVFMENYGADTLGVGSNMAKAIRYWLKTMNLTIEKPKEGTILSELGKLILWGDPYLEDVFTIWLLHCQIVENEEMATSWSFFFNAFSYVEFTKREMTEEMLLLAEEYTTGAKEYKKDAKFSEKSVEDDCDAILRMYAKRKEEQFNPEEKNKSPFWKLGLLKATENGYEKQQPQQNHIPKEILYYVLVKVMGEKKSIYLDDLRFIKNGPGNMLHLKRTLLLELLEQLEEQKKIMINRTAGLNMVYLNEKVTRNDIVREYYERRGVHNGTIDKVDTDKSFFSEIGKSTVRF